MTYTYPLRKIGTVWFFGEEQFICEPWVYKIWGIPNNIQEIYLEVSDSHLEGSIMVEKVLASSYLRLVTGAYRGEYLELFVQPLEEIEKIYGERQFYVRVLY